MKKIDMRGHHRTSSIHRNLEVWPNTRGGQSTTIIQDDFKFANENWVARKPGTHIGQDFVAYRETCGERPGACYKRVAFRCITSASTTSVLGFEAMRTLRSVSIMMRAIV
jgi:hypothetical protein